jgi:ribulose-5-phosphate 4-epimerase/fuculose-1-phosphate aldolase
VIEKRIVLPELMAEQVQLEEKDWQEAKHTAKEMIRAARIQLETYSLILEKAEKELRIIWAKLPEADREKRLQDD